MKTFSVIVLLGIGVLLIVLIGKSPAKETPREIEARWMKEEQERLNEKHEFEKIIRPICEKHGGEFKRFDHSFVLGDSKVLSSDECIKDGYTYRYEERKYTGTGGMWTRTQDIDECALKQANKEYRASPQYEKDLEEQKRLPKNVMVIRDFVPTDEQIKRGCLIK